MTLRPIRNSPGCFEYTDIIIVPDDYKEIEPRKFEKKQILNISEYREDDTYDVIRIPDTPKRFWLFRFIGQWLCTIADKLHILGSRLQGYEEE